jgi:hypothetical protein
MSNLYFTKVNWWNDFHYVNGKYEPCEEISQFFAFAPTATDLIIRIENVFSSDTIMCITIENVNACCGDNDFFYVDSKEIDKHMIELLKDANSY